MSSPSPSPPPVGAGPTAFEIRPTRLTLAEMRQLPIAQQLPLVRYLWTHRLLMHDAIRLFLARASDQQILALYGIGITAEGEALLRLIATLTKENAQEWLANLALTAEKQGWKPLSLSPSGPLSSPFGVVFGSNNGATNSFVAQGTPTELQGTITVEAVGCMILNEINENVPGSFNNLVTATLTPLIAALTAPALLNLGC